MIPAKWIILAVYSLFLVASGAILAAKHYSPMLRQLQKDYDTFRGGVEALGQAAQNRAEETRLADIKRKEDADKEHAKAVAGLNARIAGMRAAVDSGRGFLSAPAPLAASPERTCFDPAGLTDALQSLDRGFLGIVETGAKAVSDLDDAKSWAR
jgi:hypothetical protein